MKALSHVKYAIPFLAVALAPLPASAGTVRIYITNSAGDSIHVIDPATNKVVQSIAAPMNDAGGSIGVGEGAQLLAGEEQVLPAVVGVRQVAPVRELRCRKTGGVLGELPEEVQADSQEDRPRAVCQAVEQRMLQLFHRQAHAAGQFALSGRPAKLLVPLGFFLLFVQGVSEIVKLVAVMRGLIPDPHAASGPTEGVPPGHATLE